LLTFEQAVIVILEKTIAKAWGKATLSVDTTPQGKGYSNPTP
jgi:hypothetical protein